MRLSGWLGHPSDARAQADLQYVYVNGRIVKDKPFHMPCVWPMRVSCMDISILLICCF